ncbi:bifunctional DNA primase/polymerase [Caldanaerobius polysaccharolyticus]|uniref:bifunctional DNA primase/polymerase n=1 Tax=Caldanaerobius polysaccharolyticus TaxID=44256 RepID=UPI00047D25DF|nr:bifunctional DNA primase/polymerase [Caldanaerobius polysaccharolyticus]
MVKEVIALWQRGFNVLPILPNTKKPALDTWKELQHRRVTEKEIHSWWGAHPELGVAIITGAISGIVVVDEDVKRGGAEALKNLSLPPTLTVVTPSGGRHYYYKHPGGYVPNQTNILPGVDIRGDGGYVVAPPTTLANGGYVWLDQNTPIADFPKWLLELSPSSTTSENETWYEELLKGVAQGERDNAAIRLVGRWVRRGLSDEEILALLLVWNRRNKPPMGQHPGDPDEVEWAKTKIASARRMEEERKQAKPQAEELIEKLRQAEDHQAKIHLVQQLGVALQDLGELEREYYSELARKAGGFTKTALQKMLQQAATIKEPEPVPLDEPRRPYVLAAQDFYKGVFYYGMWLPTNPRAVTQDEYVFKLITSERTLLDPPKGVSPPQMNLVLRWSLDRATPYNVFEWLHGERTVDARELLDELTAVFDEFMWYPQKDTSLILALWVMNSYVFTCFDRTSYLALTGTKRSGKSRTLDILEKLCYNALATANVSTAGLARSVGTSQSTVLADETELMNSSIVAQGGVDDRLGLLLNSYQRGRLYVRAEGENYTPHGYDAYAPKAFATMNRLPDALVDRAIPIRVGRPPLGSKVGDLVLMEQEQRFQLLRNKLYFFGLTYAKRIVERVKEVLGILRDYGIVDRERDIWLVPATIAYEIGGMDLLKRVIDYNKACLQEKRGQEQSSYTVAVIWTCWKLLTKGGDDEDTQPIVPRGRDTPDGAAWYTSGTIREIVAEYMGLDPEQLSTERIGRELVATGIIDNTSDYTIRLWNKRHRGERAYLLTKERVTEAALRYEVDEVVQLFGGMEQ